MSRKVSFKLHGDKLEAALKFASDAGMDLNFLAERCLFLCMQQAYTRAAEEVNKHLSKVSQDGTPHDATSGNAEGNSVPPGQVSGTSDALSDKAVVDDTVVGA